MIRRHSATATPTACVLPGGRLRLADDEPPTGQSHNNTTTDTMTNSYYTTTRKVNTDRKKRANSWHGHNSDVIDLLLDNYDVVDIKPTDDDVVSSLNSDVTTISSTSVVSGNPVVVRKDVGPWRDKTRSPAHHKHSVDITDRLKEYDIVTSPLPPVQQTVTSTSHHSLDRLCHTTFHHSVSCGSESSSGS